MFIRPLTSSHRSSRKFRIMLPALPEILYCSVAAKCTADLTSAEPRFGLRYLFLQTRKT